LSIDVTETRIAGRDSWPWPYVDRLVFICCASPSDCDRPLSCKTLCDYVWPQM